MLMRCVVAWAVYEFLFEPTSRSGGRSAATSDVEKWAGHRCTHTILAL